MAGEINMALNAINTPLNSKESKYRELSTLLQFDQRVEEDQQKEMAAEMAYTRYEEGVSAFSESLLDGDRDQIKKKARDLQGDLKDEIQKAGSYKKFMETGGVRLLSKYRDQVVNSKEAAIYKDNAKYMAHIIKARDAGKGGLINSKDLKALSDYEKNGYGKLSYSGLLSEVDMPDAMAYEFGRQVPATDILKNENNYSAILSNFMQEHPEEGTPTGERLTKYTEEKYGLRGKNTTILQMKQQAEERAKKVAASKQNKADKKKASIWTMSDVYKGNLNRIGTDGKEQGFDPTKPNAFKESYGRGKMPGMVGKPFEQVSETDQNWNPFDTDSTRLKGARVNGAYDGTWKKALKNYEEGRLQENGTYKFNPQRDGFFGANGEKSEISESFNLTPVNVVWAGKSTMQDGTEKYIVEYADPDGNLDEDDNKNYMENMKGVKSFMTPTEVWRDEDSGYMYYREIPQESMSFQSAYTTAVKEEDDVSEIIQTEQQMASDRNIKRIQAESKKAQNRALVRQTYNDDGFKNSMNEKIIKKFNFPSNDQIFGPMTMAFAMANKTATSKDENGEYTNLWPSASSNEVDKANDYLQSMIAPMANQLGSDNLTMEKAYSVMSGQMNGMDDPQDKENMKLFLSYWKPLYESNSGKKLNLDKK